MEAKTTLVTLKARGSDHTETLEASHAERILRLSNCAWELPSNSDFQFVNNGLEHRGNKNGDSGKKKQRDNKQGDTPSGQD